MQLPPRAVPIYREKEKNAQKIALALFLCSASYGQGGDKISSRTTQICLFRGAFDIDLTSTPFQVDPQVTWSWKGPMSSNGSVFVSS